MKKYGLKLDFTAFLKFIFSLLVGAMPLGAQAYTFDENLPDYVSTFAKLDPGYYTLTNYHRNPNAGASPYYFPLTWQNMTAGQDLRLKVLLPPGTDYATLYIEAASMTAYIGACDGVTTTCSTALGRASLSLWPNPPFGGGTLSALTAPRIVSILVQAKDYPFDFSSMTVMYHIADPALYEAWRVQRNWAGGSGDCDGMGNAYCNQTTTPPTGTFALSPTSQSVTAGNSFTLSAVNGTLTSCTATNADVTLNTFVAGSTSLTGSVKATAASGTATINCTGSTGSASATLAITAVATNVFSLSPASQTVAPGAAYTLTAQNGDLSSCSSSNTAVIPTPTVSTDKKSATGSAVAGAALNSTATISCFNTASPAGVATATLTIANPPAPSTAIAITSVGIGKLTSSSAAFTATVDAAATGYWVAMSYTGTAPAQPTEVQIKAGQDASGATVTLRGNISMTAATPIEVALAGLLENTSYKVYFYAEGSTGNKSTITPISFTTNSVAVTQESITAIASGTNAQLKLDATITPASNDTGTGIYYIAAFVPGSVLGSTYGVLFFKTAQGWSPWMGGNFIPYSTETLSTKTIAVLDGSLDVSSLAGTMIYAAYQATGGSLVFKDIHVISNP